MGTQPSPSIGGAIGGILTGILNNPQVQQTLLDKLFSWLGGLFSHPKPAPPPVAPIVKPTPAPVQPDPSFPDDHIPRPVVATRKVVSVQIKLARVQLSRERFPDAYDVDKGGNQFGLIPPGPIEAGDHMNWGSKFWLDLTAYDADWNEFLYADNLTLGLAYKTEIHAGDTGIIGHGPDPTHPNRPLAGYVTTDTDAIRQGITAWAGQPENGIESSSLGFLQQFQAFAGADGKSFDCWGKVDGVESNHFTLNVS